MAAGSRTDPTVDLLVDVRAFHPGTTDLRHRLYHDPHVGLDLPGTQQKVLDLARRSALRDLHGARTTSVSAVLLLGDMDALPIQEKIGLGYASWVEGSKIEPHLTQ
ncbi:hypothetical protein [Arthrobacter rhombi]|uniref:hypothetical protein n=1 Tax=Arthrobacter rhombi TaxID=71253 RepID=UPI003FD5265C